MRSSFLFMALSHFLGGAKHSSKCEVTTKFIWSGCLSSKPDKLLKGAQSTEAS